MYKILLCDPIAENAVQILKDAPDVTLDTAFGISGKELAEKLSGFNAVIVRSATKLTADVLEQAENLKVIGRAGSGLDNIDLEYASKKGIRVLNTPGTNAPAVAEMTIGLLFALARQIPAADNSMREGRWAKKEYTGIELNDKKLGIIGCGTIGKMVARKAAALNMRVMVHNRSEVSIADVNFEQVTLNRLLTHADFITIHLSRSDETLGIIGSEEIDQMKDGSFLINTARGGMVVEKELLRALNSGKLAGAALDVFENEPDYNKELVAHPKVIATPHIAASTKESQERVGVQIIDQILEYLRSKYIFL